MRRNPPNRGIERKDTINGDYLNESLHGDWMCIYMNPLEVDVGRKKTRRMLATPLHPPVWGIAYSSK